MDGGGTKNRTRGVRAVAASSCWKEKTSSIFPTASEREGKKRWREKSERQKGVSKCPTLQGNPENPSPQAEADERGGGTSGETGDRETPPG